MKYCTGLLGALLMTLAASSASAFCGFYVSGADAELYNNATMVSLMRDGKRTVLSMQNNYEGPAEDFAMVVPVPVVLKKKDVKTLPEGLFDSLDSLTAPRLVEYWERDPCHRPPPSIFPSDASSADDGSDGLISPFGGSRQPPKVKVEASFKVGEYDIVVLSSTESTALEDWLDQNNYDIPDGAAPYFKPYIQKGQYFFVAKVDIDKVNYKNGEAVLSPIRFHYDSDEFALPVRLGLINSKGAQDLIAFILAKGQRYEVANFPNVTIPTNIPVKPETKKSFASFYSELFDNILKENPQAVVTEYAWNAATCDPCPKQPLEPDELMSLGADVLPSTQGKSGDHYHNPWRAIGRDWVVTRLHTRYGKHTLGEDLVFEAAPGIRGGRGAPQGTQGKLGEQEAEPSPRNQFQGRYVIRHFWDGELSCDNPTRGRWGGPGGRVEPQANAARNLAFSEDTGEIGLASYIDDQDAIPGLKEPVGKYDAPAGDVISSWGKLVEEPALQETREGAEGPNTDEGGHHDEPRENTTSERTGQDSRARDGETGGCATDDSASAAMIWLSLLGLGVLRLRDD